MFSTLFRTMRTFGEQPHEPGINEQPGVNHQPEDALIDQDLSPREILEYNNRCLATYQQIIEINKKIAADIMESSRHLMQRYRQIRTCPRNHNLIEYTTLGGNCDVCNRIVFIGEQVMDCRRCNWYMCARCANNNGFNMPVQSQAPASTLNELFTQPPAPGHPINSLFTQPSINIDFIQQFMSTLLQPQFTVPEDVVVTPTEAQINKACSVMLAKDMELPENFTCPIDLSPVNDTDSMMKIKQCGHVFRENNLRELFTRDVRCPMCRFDIRDHVEVTASGGSSESSDVTPTLTYNIRYNAAGNRVDYGRDGVHNYCGRNVGGNYWHGVDCYNCDGICGPHDGCNCKDCHELDDPSIEPALCLNSLLDD